MPRTTSIEWGALTDVARSACEEARALCIPIRPVNGVQIHWQTQVSRGGQTADVTFDVSDIIQNALDTGTAGMVPVVLARVAAAIATLPPYTPETHEQMARLHELMGMSGGKT